MDDERLTPRHGRAASCCDDVAASSDTGNNIRDEILDGLEMPHTGLRTWFEHLDGFCRAHGGARYYGELMRLFDAYHARLDIGDHERADQRPGAAGQ